MTGVRVRFGGYQGEKSVHSRALLALQQSCRQGAIEIDLEPNITRLGRRASDLLGMTENGELDGCYFSSSYLAARVPTLGVFDQHFRVPDRQRAYAMFDGALGERFARDIADRTGYRLLACWDNGFRHISSSRPVRRPADCAGLRLRTLDNESHQRVFRALGFSPEIIDVKDLPEAVASGRVDAQENPLTNIYNFGLHKTHRHVTLTRHLLGIALLLVNGKRFDSLSASAQEELRHAAGQATATQRRLADEEDTSCASALAAEGAEILQLDDDVRAEFAARTGRAVEETRAQFPDDLVALFDNAT